MKQDSRGFTLIELTITIILMGFVLSLTLPRIRDGLLTDDFKSASRRMITVISDLRNRAVSEYRDFTLVFDLESGKYWVEAGDMTEIELLDARDRTSVLPESVELKGILFLNGDEITTGMAGIRFTRKGYIQPSMIHMGAKDGRKFTFILSPFLGKVQIVEDYLDFEDMPNSRY